MKARALYELASTALFLFAVLATRFLLGFELAMLIGMAIVYGRLPRPQVPVAVNAAPPQPPARLRDVILPAHPRDEAELARRQEAMAKVLRSTLRKEPPDAP